MDNSMLIEVSETVSRGTFIARDSVTGFHFFIRVIARGSMYEASFRSEKINELLIAKSHKQFVEAVALSDVLIHTELFGSDSREMSPGEAARLLEERFEKCDGELLARELYFASSRPLRANAGKNSPACEYDGTDDETIEWIRVLDPDLFRVVIEPVQDWVCFRNMLSICASLKGRLEAGSLAPLTESGFELVRFGRDYELYVIPFKFNIGHSGGGMLSRIAERMFPNVGNRPVNDRLLYLFAETCEPGNGSAAFIRKIGGQVLGTAIAPGNELEIKRSDRIADPNEYLFLGSVKRDDTEEVVAKEIVNSIWLTIQELVDTDGTPLGLSKGTIDAFGEETDRHCCTWLSLLWYQALLHPEKRLTVCKWCGSAKITPNKGPVARFCNDSCRVQYNLEKATGDD